MWKISKKQTKFVIVWGGGGIQNLGGEIPPPPPPPPLKALKKTLIACILMLNTQVEFTKLHFTSR